MKSTATPSYTPCQHCQGTGVATPETSIARKGMFARLLDRFRLTRVTPPGTGECFVGAFAGAGGLFLVPEDFSPEERDAYIAGLYLAFRAPQELQAYENGLRASSLRIKGITGDGNPIVTGSDDIGGVLLIPQGLSNDEREAYLLGLLNPCHPQREREAFLYGFTAASQAVGAMDEHEPSLFRVGKTAKTIAETGSLSSADCVSVTDTLVQGSVDDFM